MSPPKVHVRPHIKMVSNKRRKSFSLSPSVSSSRSASVVISPKKRRKVFVVSEDEEIPQSDSPTLSVKKTTRRSTSDDFNAPAGSSSSYEAPDLVCYSVLPDEITEDDNLQIIGETDPADLSADSEDEHDDIPVRLLTDFTIYEMETCNLVPVAELLQIQFDTSTIYGASGKVKPYVEDDDDDDEDDDIDDDNSSLQGYRGRGDQIVKLSKILEFDLHHVSSRQKKLDSKMYLRTKYAWYILDSPSAIYSTFFTGFWLQHRILHLVVTAAMTNRRITFDDFIASLKVTPATSDAIAVAIKMLGRELTEEDVESDDVKSYLLVTLDELREQERIKIDRVPLIRTLREGSDFIEDNTSLRSASRSLSPQKKSAQSSVNTNLEREVLKHRNPTVVTPLVSCIAKTLFERTLSVAGQLEKDDIEEDVASDVGPDYMHHDDPDSVEWLESTDFDGYYQSVDMDGVVYSVGETVMVVPGQDTNHTRSKNAIAKTSQTTNTLGNTMWFCRICYMYEKGGEKMFHGQWYTHGSKTLLQETAHPQSLFLMDACETDIPLASIFQKCNLRELGPGEDEPTDESTENENNFYHGLTWIEKDSSMVELTQADIDDALAYCDDRKPCISCGLEKAENFRTEFRPLPPRGFFQRGDRYHNDDFVYVIPSTGSNDTLYKIGQITKIKAMETPPKVVVRLFGRFDTLLRKMQRKGKLPALVRSDNRRLFKTSDVIKVDANQIDGKCYVQHLTDSDAIDEWVQHDDHYFVNQWAESASTGNAQDLQMLAPAEFKLCPGCHEDHVQQLCNVKRLLERHGPLRGLELFSGAGGLGTGLDMSGFVETRWAVEFSPSAALTYQANHPETTVYNQCSNLLLQHAIDSRDGKQRNALCSLHDGKTSLPTMPKPGEVDFVYGGPPCQSFSGANHWKKANDIRSTLVCNMLSYVEFYRPSYFLLENVVGLLQYPLKGRMVGRAFVEGIKMGVVKFIVRTLTCLGYQVKFKVLQAGQYGAPQSRKRVLFWGAKRGLPLPDFPIPTHGFPKGSFYHTLATGAKLPPPSRSKDSENLHMYAPLYPTTVNDAIGDLPAFDWINPHQICKSTPDDEAETKHRLDELEIQQFNAVIKSRVDVNESFSGFVDSEPYAHKPLNRYQKALRTQVKTHCVNYQYTRKFGAGIVERVASIPLRANAYHDDLPRRLRMKSAIMDGGSRNFEGIFGRIDGNGYFRTAMTTVAPNAKGGTLLHPSQKRIVTVQECARAQGFPDHYQFLSVNKLFPKIVEDQHRQIGNAVPCPLAMALGKSLGQVLVKTWQESDRAGSPEV